MVAPRSRVPSFLSGSVSSAPCPSPARAGEGPFSPPRFVVVVLPHHQAWKRRLALTAVGAESRDKLLRPRRSVGGSRRSRAGGFGGVNSVARRLVAGRFGA